MGLTIRAKRDPETSIDMGAGGFLRLRNKIASLAGEPWASHYDAFCKAPISVDKSFYKQFDETTLKMVRKKQVPVKLIDFCLQSDLSGAIHYGACKQLLKIIRGYDDDICYGYAGRPDCAMFKDFKAILQECAEKKCDMVWY